MNQVSVKFAASVVYSGAAYVGWFKWCDLGFAGSNSVSLLPTAGPNSTGQMYWYENGGTGGSTRINCFN